MKIQFSLRTFLIAVAIIGVVLLPAANFLYQIKSQIYRQRAAVTRLQDAGSMAQRASLARPAKEGVRYKNEKADWYVHFARDYIDSRAYEPHPEVALFANANGNAHLDVATCEAQLTHVRDLYQVERLGLQVERVTGAMLEQVAALPDLNSLTLQCKAIDPEALSRLAELDQIEELILETPINDKIVSAVEKMHGLTELSINPSALSAESATKLGNCKQLKLLWVQRGNLAGGELFKAWGKRGTAKMLYLVDCNLDSEATKALSYLKTLEELKLFQKCVASNELSASVSGLVNLKDLTARLPEAVPIADQCKHLANLKKLERLDLREPMMTAAGLEALQPLANLRYFQLHGEFTREELEQFLLNGPKSCRIRQNARDGSGLVVDLQFQSP